MAPEPREKCSNFSILQEDGRETDSAVTHLEKRKHIFIAMNFTRISVLFSLEISTYGDKSGLIKNIEILINRHSL